MSEALRAEGDVVVLGANGQLGRAFTARLREEGVAARALDRSELDLARPETVAETIERLGPSVVINAAAYTDVPRAEQEEALARRINVDGPGELARACARIGASFVHFSTDYVFSGEGERPWKETDPAGPLNAYGRTKLEGERRIAEVGGSWLIFRTSWVYDSRGRNFVNTIRKLGAERSRLEVVTDQIGAPTYAPHLAQWAWRGLMAAKRAPVFPSGIYHLANSGETSWHGFALAIFAGLRARGVKLEVSEVAPVRAADFPSPVRRPLNSRLDLSRARAELGIVMPEWTQGLEACLDEIMKESA